MSTEDGHTLTGDIRSHPRFLSALLGNRRDVLVYLPPGYARSRMRYPVFYMHDGQNLFDAATAFVGVEWGVDETAQRLILAKQIAPVIIVAVANAGVDRLHEYTPTRGLYEMNGQSGRSRALAGRYGRFLAEELKPFIDGRYRTRPEPEFTGLGGSSLGGLATLVLGLRFPKVFNRLAVMSPSVWWDDCIIYQLVETTRRKLPLKIWLDTGTAEPGWERTRGLRDRLIQKGWQPGKDLSYVEAEGSGHDEGAWAMRMEEVLRFLFPPRRL
jgi:predicted alpha/beta superfamily hydrolase